MASSVVSSFHASNLRSAFLGERNGIRVPTIPVKRLRFTGLTVQCKESRVGKQPIEIPSNVTVTLEGQNIKAKGPLGELALSYPQEIEVFRNESILNVKKAVETRRANQMHGLFRTLTSNMVVGVSKGFEKKLQLIGVGYRAEVDPKGKVLTLNLGFSIPIIMQIPDDIKVTVEDSIRVTVSGKDKSNVGQFAASIRKWRPPEPYKGKGVLYAGEFIKKKEAKSGKKQ